MSHNRCFQFWMTLNMSLSPLLWVQQCFLWFWSSTCIGVLLLLQPFYDPLSGTTWVSWYQKDKLFWILLKQGWWGGMALAKLYASYLHISPEDNCASTISLRFLWAGCSSWHPTNSIFVSTVLWSALLNTVFISNETSCMYFRTVTVF